MCAKPTEQRIPAFLAGSIKSQGAFYAATGDAGIGFVDVRDIAAVAARVLTSDGHAGQIYTLTGSEALNYSHVAEKLSALLGRPVKYVAITSDQLRQSMREMGMPPWQVEALTDLQAYYTDGPGGKVSGDVRAVLGREPIRFDQFLKDYAAAFSAAAA